MDEVPDPVKLDVGFASYESKTEARGHSLHYSRTYTLREVTLPASKYKSLQDLAGVIAADEESRVILKREEHATATVSETTTTASNSTR